MKRITKSFLWVLPTLLISSCAQPRISGPKFAPYGWQITESDFTTYFSITSTKTANNFSDYSTRTNIDKLKTKVEITLKQKDQTTTTEARTNSTFTTYSQKEIKFQCDPFTRRMRYFSTEKNYTDDLEAAKLNYNIYVNSSNNYLIKEKDYYLDYTGAYNLYDIKMETVTTYSSSYYSFLSEINMYLYYCFNSSYSKKNTVFYKSGDTFTSVSKYYDYGPGSTTEIINQWNFSDAAIFKSESNINANNYRSVSCLEFSIKIFTKELEIINTKKFRPVS